ncbi:hypothetical protein BD779DRAFT_1448492 [Infundibulicybe gibba]|nr:hypothetical protein BD779DRAFT_1448492 [Infundibulicybe gibba]
MALHGWHSGERIIRQKLGLDHDPSTLMLYMSIDGDLPADHGVFHSTRLPFVPVTTLDAEGRPWGSILASGDGNPGFIQNSKYTTLNIDAKVWDGDPIVENASKFSEGDEMLVAGIGIEFTTRRRNKFAGKLTKLRRANDTMQMELVVNQAIGQALNCPKYINVRDLIPHPITSPKIIYNETHLSPADRLPPELIQLILQSDTVFLGSSYHAPPGESHLYPSHLGMNQRGGRPGFIRVASDGRTVVLPDFSGNRFMTSLGNIESTSLASLTFVSFTTGDVLYLTGTAENLCGPDAQALMPFQNALTTVYLTGYTFVRDALTVRQRAGTLPQPSPYSPPIRLLAEEGTGISTLFKEQEPITALLTRVDIHSSTIATFTWESSTALKIIPGQAVILDFTSLLGKQQYQHMAAYKPSSVNDDRLRTWTVSRTSGKRNFSLTMREKTNGVVTGALFSIARKVAQLKPEALRDTRPLNLTVRVAGVTGAFTLPDSEATIGNGELGLVVPQASLQPPQPQLLWVAGGIGVTPFLAMLDDLRKAERTRDIHLVLATREPEIFIPMILELIPHDSHHRVTFDVFSNNTSEHPAHPNVSLTQHAGRIPQTFWDGLCISGDVFVCGPESFEKDIWQALTAVGVDAAKIKTEGFEY